MPLGRNYYNEKCHWKYISLCLDCARDIEEGSNTSPGTFIDQPVYNMPIADRCEECNRKLINAGDYRLSTEGRDSA